MTALLMAIFYPELVQAVIADSTIEHWDPEAMQAEVGRRNPADPMAAAFWRLGHGDDWQQVVEADSEMLVRTAQSGELWSHGRLSEIRCPVLFTASLNDTSLLDAGRLVVDMARQVQDSKVFFTHQGSHPLMWSRPDDFRAAARLFLNSIYPEHFPKSETF